VAVVVWLTEGTWAACVDAVRTFAPTQEIALLHVTGDDAAEAAHAAYRGLLGRGHPERDPGARLEELAAQAAADLLDAAVARLGRSASRLDRRGRVERKVVQAAQDADMLVLARDGDRTRLGPHSLGPQTRFVVDHAPCPVLLVWPEPAPDVTSLPHASPHKMR
jgi:nucleotide-binding universal stress UspA family protein